MIYSLEVFLFKKLKRVKDQKTVSNINQPGNDQLTERKTI